MTIHSIVAAKILQKIIHIVGKSHGGTWPGHIALKLDPNIIEKISKKNPKLKIILITGTNGKTTTSLLLTHILRENGFSVLHNESGANLLNGIATTLLANANISGRLEFDYAIFEVDENTLPHITKHIHPEGILFLNLFRDQLDRFGEVNTVVKKWKNAINNLSNKTVLYGNGDDPQITHVLSGSKNISKFFCIPPKYKTKKSLGHDVDSAYCPSCNQRLEYSKISFSHLGDFKCPACEFKSLDCRSFEVEDFSLEGNYNKYNLSAAVLVAADLGKVSKNDIQKYVKTFKPAFGRQEDFLYKGKSVRLILAKNPTGFNQTLETVLEKSKSNDSLLILLNDRVPDGRDISWIWDVDFEDLKDKFEEIALSGDRVYDLGIRFKYEEIKNILFTDPNEALDELTQKSEGRLYILATYSAMLGVRKILSGRSIL